MMLGGGPHWMEIFRLVPLGFLNKAKIPAGERLQNAGMIEEGFQFGQGREISLWQLA